ncbi:relaxase/mobilization nuclease domain-containing protein [Acidicapsa ligni]|uniref:relaxase/mobilization nuclease domain-containing protein n=1 Tax=Acidicapsa ligni TaxID=542300 RepID=UPI0021E0219D|nr:hypothetical protein [Acidicapsa ligni]
MISKGTTHNNGVRLAAYMITGKEGERAELWQLRGFAATNIKDAFRDVQIMSGASRCEQPFFHVQVRNREGETLTRQQWELTADRIERMLGLSDQPRAISFHTYEHNNDEHMHVAWSRIDEQTLSAKALPYFKLRLKSISRELEAHFALEPVVNHREGKIKFAPTRAEEEQARRLGQDSNELRNTIRDCWDRADCGRSFQAALEHEGMTLAQGERRDFVVIDRAGGLHVLGKRILDMTAAKIRDRLSDLSRDDMPTVGMVRAMVEPEQERTKGRQPERREQEWDRDRADRDWQNAVINAAIDREKLEREYVEPEDRKKREGVGSRKKDGSEQTPSQTFNEAAQDVQKRENAPDHLRGPNAAIYAAYKRSSDAHSFVRSLEERGFTMAIATSEDVRNNNIDQFYKTDFAALIPHRLREGDYVAVADNGQVYNLNLYTTGEKTDRVQKFMAALDPKEFKGVYATLEIVKERGALREIERQAFRDLSAGKLKGERDARPTGRLGKKMRSKGADPFGPVISTSRAATRTVGKTLDAFSDAFASLFSPTLTPEQIRQGEVAGDRREAEADHTADFARYTSDMAQQRQQQEIEREAERQRVRERGGRDR